MERFINSNRTINQSVVTDWLVHSIGIKKRNILAKDVSLSDPARARTEDPKIKSLLLYQLSYGVKFGVQIYKEFILQKVFRPYLCSP